MIKKYKKRHTFLNKSLKKCAQSVPICTIYVKKVNSNRTFLFAAGDGNIEYKYLYLSSYYFYFKSRLN